MPNPNYIKGRRWENKVAKFFRGFFGKFGDASRSFMSRGIDVSFVEYLMRVWAVSCKFRKLPKWARKELETHDIVAVKEDYQEEVLIISWSKATELFGELLNDAIKVPSCTRE